MPLIAVSGPFDNIRSRDVRFLQEAARQVEAEKRRREAQAAEAG